MFAELADEPKFVAIKESSENVRRITDLKNVCGDRYLLFCGVDDLVLESVVLGAVGWVSGLVNAFPAENRLLWDLATAGKCDEALAVYRWYTPLLHLDTHVKLVQYIKLAVAECGLRQRRRSARRGCRWSARSARKCWRSSGKAIAHAAEARAERTADRAQHAMQRIQVIDSHTGGEPTRVVVAGGPDLGGGTLAERREAASASSYDRLPLAPSSMSRAAPTCWSGRCCASRPIRRCVAGVIFFNNVGYLGMCGHGTIGVAVTLAHLGRIGAGTHRLETPVGVVAVDYDGGNRVDDRERAELPPRGRRHASTVEGYGAGHRRRRLGRQLVLPRRRPRPGAGRWPTSSG